MRVPRQYSEEVFPIRHLSNRMSYQDPGEQGQIRIMNGKITGGVCLVSKTAGPTFLFHKRQQAYGLPAILKKKINKSEGGRINE